MDTQPTQYKYSDKGLLAMTIGGFFFLGIVLWPMTVYMANKSRKMGDNRTMTHIAFYLSAGMCAFVVIGVIFGVGTAFSGV